MYTDFLSYTDFQCPNRIRISPPNSHHTWIIYPLGFTGTEPYLLDSSPRSLAQCLMRFSMLVSFYLACSFLCSPEVFILVSSKKKRKKEIYCPMSLNGPRFFFFFGLFAFSRATPTAYGGSQARGLIRSVAAGLRQSHSNVGSKPRLQPTPQLTATPDLHWARPGIEPTTSWFLVGFVNHWATTGTPLTFFLIEV